MYKLARVNERWRLTERYPEFRHNTWCLLKEYGYMEIFKYLDENPNFNRLLEFGRGFNTSFFTRYEKTREVWAINDYQGLAYFPDKEGWEGSYKDTFSEFAEIKFVRGLLGNLGEQLLPDEYFDFICAVSVLEEVSLETVAKILSRCHKLLRPGGVLVQTHDIVLHDSQRLNDHLQLHRMIGFKLDESGRDSLSQEVLIEPRTQVMLAYQTQEPLQTRKYWGNFGTMFTIATKV